MKKIRLGLMGFGRIGRQLYRLSLDDESFDIVAISDVGNPDVLRHLLSKMLPGDPAVTLEGNYLVGPRGRTRMMPDEHPTEIPWDLFDVDFVIDATGRYRTVAQLQPHIDNGARRVILSTLPESAIDRVVIPGVNEAEAAPGDRIVSAGSASTTAAALALNIMAKSFPIDHASMTSVHAYTSDQRLQDYAGTDYRRSRSGSENIIPNATPALDWIPRILPGLAGRFSAYALNVPVQVGSMLDLTLALQTDDVDTEAVNSVFVAAAKAEPRLVDTVSDPIVSSDIKGSAMSLIVDLQGTLKAGTRTIKILGWHETLGHARRILDVASLYRSMDMEARP